MTFIEAVTRKLDDHVPHILSFFFAQPVLHGTAHVLFIILSDQSFLLFTDRFNTGVRCSQTNAADTIEDLHHLFLVDHDAVGLFQDLLHRFGLVLGLLPPVLDLDIVLNHTAFERPRAIKRIGRDHIAEMVRLHLLQQITNPAALQLEHALGFTTLQ